MLRFLSLGSLGIYWIAIFIGTHIPHGVRGVARVHDKILHFGAYAGLAFLLAAALTTLRMRHGSLLLPLAVAAVYGCFDELSQLAVPGRQAELADWAADVFGAGLGILAFGLLSLIFTRRRLPSPSVVTRDAVTESAA